MLTVLDQLGTMGIVPGEDAPLVAGAAQTPVAAMHAAAALVAWLYGQRSVVFDQTTAVLAAGGVVPVSARRFGRWFTSWRRSRACTGVARGGNLRWRISD